MVRARVRGTWPQQHKPELSQHAFGSPALCHHPSADILKCVEAACTRRCIGSCPMPPLDSLLDWNYSVVGMR
eukprot:4187883-Alexandrium_andersonii.AAC.1